MKNRMLPLSAFAISLFLALPASAACYADYKAKKASPLRLHYGVIELPDAACGNRKAAASEVEKRLTRNGWQLLNVMSLFDQGGLAERKDSAGQYFLRF
ncbi:hypothetical protein OE856_08115 [Actibacterium sp. XHP0104]|nr:hypothetical protein [Actibacterium sp. XHP0104]MCV2881989.1 hypothetical protein [Actibacterium sp. XHP0104]